MLNQRPSLLCQTQAEKKLPQGPGAFFNFPSKDEEFCGNCDFTLSPPKVKCQGRLNKGGLHLNQTKNPNFKLSKIINGNPDHLAMSDVEGVFTPLSRACALREIMDCEFPYCEVL